MTHNILLVDDEERILNALKRALRDEDLQIFTATSGQEAIALLEGREFDVIISDHNMPGMSGLELLARVKALSPETITMMLTGKSDIEIAMQAINDAGVYKFILKPWDTYELIINIRRACESLDLVKERNYLVEKIRSRDAMLKQLEKEHPGITKVTRDDDGCIIADDASSPTV